MKVKEGDVLVCECEDCDLELVVRQGCTKQSCGCDSDGADITVTCCDKPMVLQEKKGGCCCCGD
jgi:hypothetical protein